VKRHSCNKKLDAFQRWRWWRYFCDYETRAVTAWPLPVSCCRIDDREIIWVSRVVLINHAPSLNAQLFRQSLPIGGNSYIMHWCGCWRSSYGHRDNAAHWPRCGSDRPPSAVCSTSSARRRACSSSSRGHSKANCASVPI